jgi:NhaP-type Na+/H+ or K+/H+ antiporter
MKPLAIVLVLVALALAITQLFGAKWVGVILLLALYLVVGYVVLGMGGHWLWRKIREKP